VCVLQLCILPLQRQHVHVCTVQLLQVVHKLCVPGPLPSLSSKRRREPLLQLLLARRHQADAAAWDGAAAAQHGRGSLLLVMQQLPQVLQVGGQAAVPTRTRQCNMHAPSGSDGAGLSPSRNMRCMLDSAVPLGFPCSWQSERQQSAWMGVQQQY